MKVLFLLAHSQRSIPSGQSATANAEENLPSKSMSMSSLAGNFRFELLIVLHPPRSKTISTLSTVQSGASYLSQGFEDNVLESSTADWLIL